LYLFQGAASGGAMVQLHQVNYILHHMMNDPSGADLMQNVMYANVYVSSLLLSSVANSHPRSQGWLDHAPIFNSCLLAA